MKASAGSGKTYSLTQTCLDYLSVNPTDAYRRVMAVTFTNKATAEMKDRIVQALAEKAKPGSNPAPFDSNQAAYKCLSAVLQDYTRFHVMTIDQFFQKILRNFVRELKINQAYEVETNTSLAIDYAVDAFFKSLEVDDSLYGWLEDYLNDDSENFADVRKKLKSIAQWLDKENMAAYLPQLTEATKDKSSMKTCKDQMRSRLDELDAEFARQSKELYEQLESMPLSPKDWDKYNVINKLKTITVSAGADIVGKSLPKMATDDFGWVKKDFIPQVTSYWTPDWQEKMHKFFDWKEKNKVEYQTLTILLRNFSNFVILADLNRHYQQYQKDNHSLLISSCPQLVNDLIHDCETPFIYERVGMTIEHYMLDEFQDTSTKQWSNFKPLLDMAKSQGDEKKPANLVVGDVKQSIYRWRNSNWQLLSGLDEECKDWKVKTETLKNNWRSCPEIVRFNNALFDPQKGAPAVIHQYFEENFAKLTSMTGIPSLYQDSAQEPALKEDGTGRVELRLFEKTERSNDAWHESARGQMLGEMRRLRQESGYAWSDFAVLVRYQRHAVELADFLVANGVPVLSTEALSLQSSPAIHQLLLVLQAMAANDANMKSWLAVRYPAYASQQTVIDTQVVGKPLFEAIEQLILLLELNQDSSQAPYLQAFQDSVGQYLSKGTNDYEAFLKWWLENGSGKSIVTPEGIDAVTISTIHKSKGLDYGVVFVPYCDWETCIDQKKASEILVKPGRNISLPVIPVEAKSVLSETDFRDSYLEEEYRTIIDNLNLMYVAFTRPKCGLYVYGPDESDKSDKLNSVNSLLKKCFTANASESGQWVYQQGRLPKAPEHKQVSGLVKELSYPVEVRDMELRLHDRDEESARSWGTKLHAVLEKVGLANDLDAALDEHVRAGNLTDKERQTAKEELTQMLALPDVKPWFDGSMQVKAEAPILTRQGTWRPDRVLLSGNSALVVDYKFGEPKNSYGEQVRRYMRLLSEMGYTDVRGAIYYHLQKRVERVS